MDQKEMLDRLIENALDFLRQSINEIDSNPKYSIIHFHAGLELFIKARLMAEHWTLVISPRQEPSWDKFKAGDFQSVTLAEAANRLDKVIQSKLPQNTLDAFKSVSDHRNKMVHFFHEAHSSVVDTKLIEDIVMQQLKAWFYLHELLINQWKDIFKPWTNQITKLDSELRGLHKFLNAIFIAQGDEIRNLKINGFLITDCPSCGFAAQPHPNKKDEVYESKCLVCKLTQSCLHTDCPSCPKTVFFQNSGYTTCDCKRKFDPKYLTDLLIDGDAAHGAKLDGDDSWDLGNCHECESHHTIVRTKQDYYICTNCFTEPKSISSCDWCGEINTGDMEDSFLYGCSECDGRYGWDKDD